MKILVWRVNLSGDNFQREMTSTEPQPVLTNGPRAPVGSVDFKQI